LIMQRIEDKQYRNVSDVTKAAGLVSVFAYESGTGAACTGSSVQDQTGCDQITMPEAFKFPLLPLVHDGLFQHKTLVLRSRSE
jgi:hypothetical protein